VAATGVGAGDLVAAAVSGASYGYALLWTAVAGAFLKFALTDGIARWQLVTGTSVLAGWLERFGRPAGVAFGIYLVLWTLFVASALMSVCGLALHAAFPFCDARLGAVAHAMAGLALVWSGRYQHFERAMKLFVGVMFVAIVGSAVAVPPPLPRLAAGLLPAVPAGALPYSLAVLGGVGGTVTLLSYGYWMRERGWVDRSALRWVRIDLLTAYVLTGLFGLAVMALAADVLHVRGLTVEGRQAVLTMAEMLGDRAGAVGRAVFLAGFWGAVASSLLGVWQGIPYLFADLWGRLRGSERLPGTQSRVYRAYLIFITLPPMLLLVMEPVGLVLLYAALGALFMPFLAASLLIMLNRAQWTGGVRNGWVSNAALLLSLGIFAYLGLRELLNL
jgi:Mn2+/Fe2+ NRAMP family transporter